jgi:hypothetical protein
MADRWTVTIHGAEPLERRIRQFELLLSDLRPFWPMVVPMVTGWWRKQFDTEGAFAGRPWHPLTQQYSLFKQRIRPGRKILYFDGDLLRAASKPERRATARTLTLSIEDPKIEYLQEGTGRMVARPLVFGDPLPFAARAELDQAAERYVGDFLRRL